jgi:predicted PurR-regulated permease PerM
LIDRRAWRGGCLRQTLLMSRGGGMPLVLVLLGGATAFGFIGVFLGPTLLAVGYRWLDEIATVP